MEKGKAIETVKTSTFKTLLTSAYSDGDRKKVIKRMSNRLRLLKETLFFKLVEYFTFESFFQHRH